MLRGAISISDLYNGDSIPLSVKAQMAGLDDVPRGE